MWWLHGVLGLILALAGTGISAVPGPNDGLRSTGWDHALQARPDRAIAKPLLRLEARMNMEAGGSGSGSGGADDRRGLGGKAVQPTEKKSRRRGGVNYANKMPPGGGGFESAPKKPSLSGNRHGSSARRQLPPWAAREASNQATAPSRPPLVNVAGSSGQSSAPRPAPRFVFAQPPLPLTTTATTTATTTTTATPTNSQSRTASISRTNPTTVQSAMTLPFRPLPQMASTSRQQALMAALTARPSSPTPSTSSLPSRAPSPSRHELSTDLSLALPGSQKNPSSSSSPRRDGK